jgi:hypothetical protein
MSCSVCGDCSTENLNGILIKGKFFCSNCSTVNENLCDSSTREEVKGFLKGQAGILNLLEQQFGLVEAGKAYDSFKEGRREGTQFGVYEENKRILEAMQAEIHNDPYGGCQCVECRTIKKLIRKASLES